MSNFDKEVSTIANDLSTIILAIVSIQVSSLKDWCDRNNWSDFELVQFQFYAIPPGDYIPVPIPKEAFALSDKYQQVFDILREIQFLERGIRGDLDKTLMFHIACVPILFIKTFLKTSNAFVSVPIVIYKILDLSIAMLVVTALVYLYGSLSSRWQCRQHKKKLRKMSDIVDLIISLDRGIHPKHQGELA